MVGVKENMVESRCSKNVPVKFHWFDGNERENIDPIEVAVDRCFAAVDGEHRMWNPHTKAMTRSEFRNTIKYAAHGRLKPVDQVTEVGHDPVVPMYEIRWQHTIQVTDRTAEGDFIYGKALVRLYHSEPPTYPDHFIGHHAHEKIISADDATTRRLQTTEIEVAKSIYRYGEKVDWYLAS